MLRRWLSAIGLSSDVEADWRRQASAALAKHYAWTGAKVGVKTPLGPRTQEMVDRFRTATEGRATWSGYSCCCDICGVVLSGLGLRDERIVNRDDDDLDGVPDDKQQTGRDVWDGPGTEHWRVTQNIIMFHSGSRAAGYWRTPGGNRFPRFPEQGDMPLIGGETPADGGASHVFIIASDLTPADAADWPKYAKQAWVCDAVHGGQVDEGGQCVQEIATILWLDASGTMWCSRVGKPGARKVQGWIDVTALALTAPAQLPDDCDVGREVNA